MGYGVLLSKKHFIFDSY